jgi:hypothetical protein
MFHGGSHLTLISHPNAVTAAIASAICSLTGSRGGAPTVGAGTGGMAAPRPADDAPWLAAGAAGALLLAGAGAFGARRRLSSR